MQLVRRIITVFILAVCALMCFSLYAQATVTITVHPQDLSSSAAPDASTSVVATLRGCGSNPPIVVGTSMLAPTSKTFTPVIGVVTMPLYSSSEISCGGQTGVTWYDITMQSDGSDVWKASYTFTAGGDLSTMAPNTSAPVVAAPTGDSTYARLDNANTGSWLPLLGGDPTLPLGGATKQYVDNLPTRNLGFTGSNTHSGTETFTGSGNKFTFLSGRVDASMPQFAGVDMCASINNARAYVVSLGYGFGEIDATGFHGRQDVITNCFANSPANATTPQPWLEMLKLAPDVKIPTSVAQNPSTGTFIDGGSPWVWPVQGSAQFASQMGAQFIAADGFNYTTQKAVLVLGYNAGTTNPRAVWLQNLGVNCISPSGTYTSGSIGIYNDQSQENTGGEGVFVNGCTTDIKIENTGSFSGAQNSGPWKRLVLQSVGVPTSETNWVAFDYCSTSGFCKTNRGIDGATISGPTGGAAGSVGVAVNSSDIAVRNVSCEEVQFCVELAKTHAAKGVTIDNITGQGHPDFNMQAVLHVVPGSITAFTAFNISSAEGQRSDYVIQDEGTGGLTLCGQASITAGSPCFGATKTTPVVTFYSCSTQSGYGVPRKCIWNTPAQQGFGTDGGATSTSANLTLDATSFAQTLVITPSSSAGLTAMLPATPPNKNWYATIINGSLGFPLFISPNGVNLMGSTATWTVAPQTSCMVYTNGTSYYAACSAAQTSLIALPNALSITTSSGDQNITCRVAGGACPAGMYRITVHATVTAAGTAGTFQPYCGYTDQSGTAHNPVNATALGLNSTSLTAIGNTYAGECVVESKGTGNIKYGVSFAGATGTPTVRVNAAAERISIQ
jgi:hypothetical protein